MKFDDYERLLGDVMRLPDFTLPEQVSPVQFRAAAAAAWINGARDQQGNIKFQKCTAQSLTVSLIKIAKWGLIPDGVWAALVPYGSDCQAQMMFQGTVELMRRIGCTRIWGEDVRHGERLVQSIDAEFMRSFRHVGPDGEDIDMMSRPAKVIGAYVRFDFQGDTYFCHVDEKDCQAAQRASQKSAKEVGPAYKIWQGEMAKKTAINRARKMLPLHAFSQGDVAVSFDDALPAIVDDAIEGQTIDHVADAEEQNTSQAQIEHASEMPMNLESGKREALEIVEHQSEAGNGKKLSKAAMAFLGDEE